MYSPFTTIQAPIGITISIDYSGKRLKPCNRLLFSKSYIVSLKTVNIVLCGIEMLMYMSIYKLSLNQINS